MQHINIHTTLDIKPHGQNKHDLLVITRGSSASLNYTLFDKVYTIDDIEQLYFIFSQNNKTTYYSMVDYFEPCAEGEKAMTDVIYYEKRVNNDYYENVNKYIPVAVNVGADVSQYYKKSDRSGLPDWQFDPHFGYEENDEYGMINFLMTPQETAELEVTDPETMLHFEVTIRLNTDSMDSLHYKDTVIVEPQHSIAVVDSLFRQILEV